MTPNTDHSIAARRQGACQSRLRGTSQRLTMKALVYLGPARRRWKIVRSRKSRRPQMRSSRSPRRPSAAPTCTSSRAMCRAASPGRILGHEGVGIVDEVGPAVTAFKPGDRVLISCISACGKCEYCRKQHVLALHHRRLDPRQQDRRHAGRVRPHPASPTPACTASRGRGRRGAGDAQRHPADRLRVRRAQRQGSARQHRGDRRRRADRPGRAAHRAVLFAGRRSS